METIVVAIISLFGTCIGTFAGIFTSSKLTMYRIEQLEKKVDKHNSVVERTALLEQNIKSVWHSINEIKENVEHVREKEETNE